MSESRGERSSIGSLVVLFLLLAGLVLLGILVVVGLGFLVSRTTFQAEAMAAREAAMAEREMAELQMQRALAAEAARRRELADPAPGAESDPLKFDDVQRALGVANQYLEAIKDKRLKDAGELLTAEYLADHQGPAGLPLADSPAPVKPPVLVGLRASAHSYRFRYQHELPEQQRRDFTIAVVPDGAAFRIKAIELLPGAPNP